MGFLISKSLNEIESNWQNWSFRAGPLTEKYVWMEMLVEETSWVSAKPVDMKQTHLNL